MYASSGNKHFFTKSCHRQTYQNYKQSQQKLDPYLKNKVHIFKIKIIKNLIYKSWSPTSIFFEEKKSERINRFSTLKNYFEN